MGIKFCLIGSPLCQEISDGKWEIELQSEAIEGNTNIEGKQIPLRGEAK